LSLNLTHAVQTAAQRVALALHQHPKRVPTAVAAPLLGGAGASFAVANLAPDAATLPQRTLVEAVEPLPLAPQLETLATQAMRLYRTDLTRSTDTADTLLKRLGVSDTAAAAFLRSDRLVQQTLMGRAGRSVSAEVDERSGLLALSARWSPEDDGNFKRLTISKSAEGYSSKIETLPLSVSSRMAGGVIQSSLFAATDDARIPDAIAVQLAEIFSGDIDFHRALRKGDRFSVVYEALEGDGEPLRVGRVISAEFVNGGKTYQAMWFKEPGANKGGYYTLDGNSLRRAFLASPMEFSRVTSGFKMRFHPILQTWRAHLGVDYAAPTGTPVRSVGDGVVDFAGVQNGFGNVVFVKHNNGQVTVYAHLSRIAVRQGQRVSQGDNLGAVGSTGWATGPHLHFEFRQNGRHQDPLTMARQSEAVPVTASAKPAFNQLAQANRQQLVAAASMRPGMAE